MIYRLLHISRRLVHFYYHSYYTRLRRFLEPNITMMTKYLALHQSMLIPSIVLCVTHDSPFFTQILTMSVQTVKTFNGMYLLFDIKVNYAAFTYRMTDRVYPLYWDFHILHQLRGFYLRNNIKEKEKEKRILHNHLACPFEFIFD